jgi:16S rRNA processing protein RimM
MPSLPENPSYVVTGRVIKPYGVLGWVKIEPLSTNPRRFQAGNAFILQGDEEGDRLLLEEARDIPGAVLAKFRGLESREEAERLKGLELMIRPEEAGEAPPGSLWEHQILGMEVRTDAGRYLGRVAEVMETGANDVLVVRGDAECLIPMIEDVVTEIDLESGSIVIKPIPGLLEE